MRMPFVPWRAWLRVLVWAVGALLTLWLVAWTLLPGFIQSQLQEQGTVLLGRKLVVRKVEFRPWALEIVLKDLEISGNDDARPQLRVKQILVNAELQSLLRWAPVIDKLTIEGPMVRLTHLGRGHYDIDDIAARIMRAEPADKPQRFALYNLSIHNGLVDFDDRESHRVHTLRDVQLGIPFLSNLDVDRQVTVEPRLAFILNGSRVHTAASVTPFGQARKASIRLDLPDVDLTPFLGYQPASLPLRLNSGVLEAQLNVDFALDPKPVMSVQGKLGMRNVQVVRPGEGEVLALKRIGVHIADARPFEHRIDIDSAEVDGPHLLLQRSANGHIGPFAHGLEVPTRPDSGPTVEPEPKLPWRIVVGQAQLRDGELNWHDELTRSKADLSLRQMQLEASGIRWPEAEVTKVQANMVLADARQAGSVTLSGHIHGGSGRMSVAIDDLPLGLAAPYLERYSPAALNGRLGAEAEMNWSESGFKVDLPRLTLARLRFGQSAAPDIEWRELVLERSMLDLSGRRLEFGRLQIDSPALRIHRDAEGRWMFEHWFKQVSQSQKVGEPTAKPPWRWALHALDIQSGKTSFRDEATVRPVNLMLQSMHVAAHHLDDRPGKEFALNVAAKVPTEAGGKGAFAFNGSASLAPWSLAGRLHAEHLPLQLVEPYFASALKVVLLRADAGFQGQLAVRQQLRGMEASVSADLTLEDFRVDSIASADPSGPPVAEELLNWRALRLQGLKLNVAPGSGLSLSVENTNLTDFFARVIVSPAGRLNLVDVLRSDEAEAAPDRPGLSSAAALVTPSAPSVQVRLGPTTVSHGTVAFSDRFVKPNYSANLTDLEGTIGSLSSVAPPSEQQAGARMADLSLHGRAEGTAALEITGRLNPLAQPPQLDIKGKVTDLELPPLSPYSVKYAGHGIERGKLSVDVAYRIEADGQLKASNKLILKQLSFGDHVETAQNTLPVKLAVALLSDRNGVIDVDLPISGSLNDPQFSIGPIIFKVIVNLIVKAVTSPFSLLAGAIGGAGDDLGVVDFAPGVADLSPGSAEKLRHIARAMDQRPALTLTVVGTANPMAERDAYRRAQLTRLVQAEKRRSVVVSARDETATVTAQEYPDLIRQIYRRADMAKPRNLLGLPKDIPISDMEALLMANIPIQEDGMNELALKRAVAVRDQLVSLQLPVDRIFLGAVHTESGDGKPRAELILATP